MLAARRFSIALQGFKTKAMRELEALQKGRVFTATLIRVQAPDRTVVQALFSPLEPASAVYAWLRADVLSDAVTAAGTPFYLYTTPPPTAIADNATTLADAQLQPAALLYLGWGTGPAAKLAPGAGAPAAREEYLQPRLLEAARGGDAAQALGGAAAAHFPSSAPVVSQQAPVRDVDAEAAAMLSGCVAPAPRGSAGGNKPGAGKPGWLKLH
jgi:hypothetical protein